MPSWTRLPSDQKRPLSREIILRILESRDPEAARVLAARPDSAPEVLYFLAEEGDLAIRRAVAANPSTPTHANRLLADDGDDEVRAELARKIGRLLPGLPTEARDKLRAMTIDTLEVLARDQLPRVRQILAEEIKSLDCVPKKVIQHLARDVETVAAPILEYSPLLSDADLIDLITSAQARYVLVAIAKRKDLRSNVADAIVAVQDIPSVAALLENATADIRQRTLEKVVDHAERIREWHQPLVQRPDLSQRAIRRIAEFVSAALLERLALRNGLDEKTRQHLKARMRSRLEENPALMGGERGIAEEVAGLERDGKLDDAFIARAAEAGRRELVVAALAHLAHVSQDVVTRIFQSGSAKPVVALVWRAGLGMRAAFRIQSAILKLPARELLPARDGVRFPMSEEEMRWHLDYFEVPA